MYIERYIIFTRIHYHKTGCPLDLFKSPSEKSYKLMIICRYERGNLQKQEKNGRSVSFKSLTIPSSLLDVDALVSTCYH